MSGDVKVTIKRDALHATLAKVARVAASKSKIRILQNVLITLGPNNLTIVGTDLDIVIQATVAADHSSPGASITVIADLLAKLVGDFPSGSDLILTWSDQTRIELKCGRSRFKVNALPAADFPEMPDLGETADFNLPAADLRRAFASVAFAISTEQSRFYLCGVYFHPIKSHLVFVSTNGHKLARIKLPRPDGMDDFAGVIIPHRCVNEMLRMVDAKAEGEVNIRLSTSGISFGMETTLLQSKLIEGTYPDYQRVIPSSNDKIVMLDFDDLLAAVGRVRTVADRTEQASSALRLTFDAEGLRISTRNAEAGEGEETIAVEPGGAAFDLDIGFNGEYLATLLGAVGTGTVRLRLADPGSPALVEGVGRDEADFVLMPMRV